MKSKQTDKVLVNFNDHQTLIISVVVQTQD